jgi:hypothetical protein
VNTTPCRTGWLGPYGLPIPRILDLSTVRMLGTRQAM